MPRLLVVLCLGITLIALAWLYPQAFAGANRTARANAELDYLDREFGGGNSVLPDQTIAIEARARIPEDDAFVVAVGAPREDWSELAVPDAIDTYMRYFLLPRRHDDDAPWVLCFACDPNAYPGSEAVWADEESGMAILRRLS